MDMRQSEKKMLVIEYEFSFSIVPNVLKIFKTVHILMKSWPWGLQYSDSKSTHFKFSAITPVSLL